MKKLPILIVVYNRYYHFVRCVESLKKCPEAINSELFISSDFYKSKKDENNVNMIRKYIKNIDGFKKVNYVFFDTNVGQRYASNYLKEKIFENYDATIFSEDDNEFSPKFLNFMNIMYDYYGKKNDVFSFSGFSNNILKPNYKSEKDRLYGSTAFAAWGYLLKKKNHYAMKAFTDKNSIYDTLTLDLNNKNFIKKINSISLAYYPHLLDCLLNKKEIAFDYSVSYYCLKNNLINIQNTNTYVKNFGHDGSGLRNEKNKSLQLLMKKIDFSKKIPELIEVEDIPLNNGLFGFYANNRIKYKMKIFLIKLGIFNITKNVLKKVFDA